MALLDAVGSAIERSRASHFVSTNMQALQNGYESLTPRERDVIALVVSGLLSNKWAANSASAKSL
jgi:FixJ family two-component response regulator